MKLEARPVMNEKSIVIFKILYFNYILPKCNVFSRGEGVLPYKKGCSSYLLEVFRSTAGALAVPFRVLGRKIMTGDI